MQMIRTGTLLGCWFVAVALFGQGVTITSVEKSGRITWTCPSLSVTCRVERTTASGIPAQEAWTNQYAVVVTHPSNETVVATPSNETDVAVFHRLVYELPDPHFPDITTEQSLALIAHRGTDTHFVVLDVRRAIEYTGRHIIDADNLDYYSPTFASDLDALDKNKVYLIHCASGYRSGKAHDTMLGLGFHEVYNMLGGMNAFQLVPGADAVLTP